MSIYLMEQQLPSPMIWFLMMLLLQSLLLSDGNGKADWRKKVLITSLVIFLFGLWMKGAILAGTTAPLRPMMTTTT